MLEKKKKKKEISVQNKFVLSTQVIGGYLYLKGAKFIATGSNTVFPGIFKLTHQNSKSLSTFLGHFQINIWSLHSDNYKSLYALQTYTFLQETRYG